MTTQYNVDGAKAYHTSDKLSQIKQSRLDWERIAANWVRYCENHDVYASVDGNAVVVSVPWTKRELDGSVTRGTDYVRCHTLKEVKAALGY